MGDWVRNGMCVLQEQEKREHLEKKGEGEEKNRGKKSQPGFDGRWYTDTDSHTQHRDRYKYTHFRSSSCLSASGEVCPIKKSKVLDERLQRCPKSSRMGSTPEHLNSHCLKIAPQLQSQSLQLISQNTIMIQSKISNNESATAVVRERKRERSRLKKKTKKTESKPPQLNPLSLTSRVVVPCQVLE